MLGIWLLFYFFFVWILHFFGRLVLVLLDNDGYQMPRMTIHMRLQVRNIARLAISIVLICCISECLSLYLCR